MHTSSRLVVLVSKPIYTHMNNVNYSPLSRVRVVKDLPRKKLKIASLNVSPLAQVCSVWPMVAKICAIWPTPIFGYGRSDQ